MARFNAARVQPRSKTVNKAGGVAYKESPKLALVSLLLTSFVKDQYYRTSKETLKELRELMVAVNDWLFVAKAAIFARTQYGMRSITHIVAAEVAKHVKGPKAVAKGKKPEALWTRRFFDKVVYRPDDITEILSFYMGNYGKPIPNSLKDGMGRALGKFDSYALSKYRGERKDLKLVDVLNLVRAKPTEKNADALAKLVKGDLKSSQTWETKLTQAGQKAAKEASNEEEKEELLKGLKKDAWKDLVENKKLGYFALLRNLRNLHEQAPELIGQVAKQLVNRKAIKKSLVLPFRYATAHNELSKLAGTQSLLCAVDDACDIAVDNVPKFDGSTLVVLDCSGSMQGQPKEIGSLFAAVLLRANKQADFMFFASQAQYHQVNPKTPVLTLRNAILGDAFSGGTNFNAIFEEATKAYDRIIILSDMQGWEGGDGEQEGGAPNKSFAEYKKRTGADPFVYSFDLQGYGKLMFPERKVYCLVGFSDKVLDVMKLLEEDREALIHKIEAVEI